MLTKNMIAPSKSSFSSRILAFIIFMTASMLIMSCSTFPKERGPFPDNYREKIQDFVEAPCDCDCINKRDCRTAMRGLETQYVDEVYITRPIEEKIWVGLFYGCYQDFWFSEVTWKIKRSDSWLYKPLFGDKKWGRCWCRLGFINSEIKWGDCSILESKRSFKLHHKRWGTHPV